MAVGSQRPGEKKQKGADNNFLSVIIWLFFTLFIAFRRQRQTKVGKGESRQ